jgi:ABC-type lipoprotein export system ATPase subunit/DNA-binding transcriptional ArsR family regulator
MTYRGDSKGALWRRWDLHVHTPASYVNEYGDRENDETWERYFSAIATLPPDISVLGINDYFTIDGYKRVKAEWDRGRFPNLLAIFPVVELRLDHLAGNAATQRLNYHVLFADDVDTQEIERGFLHHLLASIGDFSGCVGHLDGMRAYGKAARTAMPVAQRQSGSDVVVGFQHAFAKIADVQRALANNSSLRGRTQTALGYTEFANMRWSGGGGVVKHALADSVNFLFGNSETPAAHHKHQSKLGTENVALTLLDASDAHRLADPNSNDRCMGQTMTWLKCDPTFEGLRRALQRPTERVFVGNEPPQLTRLRTHRSRFIQNAEIRKIPNSTLLENWFDNRIELNPGLVAIIGNQGSGKSALTDSLALAANSEARHFSFLTPQKFRKPKTNKASQFRIRIGWADGDSISRFLNEDCAPDRPERARYVPQHFFDLATNEVEVEGAGTLYDEIEKAVFSHVPPPQRQGCTRFRELVAVRTRGMDEQLAELRMQLSECNKAIETAESKTAMSARTALRGRIDERNREITALQSAPPAVVAAPDKSELEPKLDTLRAELAKLAADVKLGQQEETAAFTSAQKLRRFADTVDRLAKKTQQAIEEAFDALGAEGDGLALQSMFSMRLELKPIQLRIAEMEALVKTKHSLHDPTVTDSPAARLQQTRSHMDEITQSLGLAQRTYEAHLSEVTEWESRLNRLMHASADPDASDALLAEQERIELILPRQLTELRFRRAKICAEIHSSLLAKLEVYRELADHVRLFLRDEELTREHYQLEFDLALIPGDLAAAFFGIVKHYGRFAGQDASRNWIKTQVDACDCGDIEQIDALITRITSAAMDDKVQDELRWDSMTQMTRVGRTVSEMYDCLYGLGFLEPRYRLALEGRPLEQLSPGERGILLLIFYLIVDQSDLPLIIDQPEGNLNNQSIYERIVPVIKGAKERRQIIMVSHNPNIVVGCDADQIIHASIDQAAGFRVSYLTGALEHPQFREFTIEKLEGTRPAFQERSETYVE